MFRHAYAIFSLIELQVICDTSYILHTIMHYYKAVKPEITELKRC